MKFVLFAFYFFTSFIALSQKTDTTLVIHNGNTCYHITSTKNTKVLIFLHGGVENPAFDDEAKVQELDFLLEANDKLIPTAISSGFDLLIPITNQRFNWLNNHAYCFENFTAYLAESKAYDEHYISGFSDGGTGAYKLFYDHAKYFDGLAIFNGYPQHQNFYKSVDYEATTQKEIVFFSTFGDKNIPYEFEITEYCSQKKSNPNTFLYIVDGTHTFEAYGQIEMDVLFGIFNSEITNQKTEPIQGYMVDDVLISFYPYRKKIYKKYGFGEEIFLLNKSQAKAYGK